MKYAMKRTLAVTALLATTGSGTALASDDVDQATARKMVESGEIMSVEAIREAQAERLAGDLLELELEEKHGGYVYELEIKGSDGHVREFYVDASNGEIIKEEREDH